MVLLVLKVIFPCDAFCAWFPTDSLQVPESEQDLLEACVVHKLGNSRLPPCPLDTCRFLVFGRAMHHLVSSADDTPDNAQDAAVVHHSHPGLLQLWQGMLRLLLQSKSCARASRDLECLRRLHSPWAWAKPEQPWSFAPHQLSLPVLHDHVQCIAFANDAAGMGAMLAF